MAVPGGRASFGGLAPEESLVPGSTFVSGRHTGELGAQFASIIISQNPRLPGSSLPL